MWVHAGSCFHLPRRRFNSAWTANGNEKLLIFRSDLLVETKREARSYVVESLLRQLRETVSLVSP